MKKLAMKLIYIFIFGLALFSKSYAGINDAFVCPSISSLKQEIQVDNTVKVKGMVFALTDEFTHENGLVSLNFENKEKGYYLYITYMPGEEFKESLIKYNPDNGKGIKMLSTYLADCKNI